MRILCRTLALCAPVLMTGCKPTDQTASARTTRTVVVSPVPGVPPAAPTTVETTLRVTVRSTLLVPGPDTTTTTTPAKRATIRETGEPKAKGDNPPKGEAKKDSSPTPEKGLRAEPATVTVEQGGQATVKLVGEDIDAPVMITVEPAERKITAMAKEDVLTIRAANDAQGDATVKVKSGEKTVTVKVTVKPADKAKK